MNLLSPFKYLYSYSNTKEDYRLFFGRESEKESVKRQLSKTKFLIVYGPSGSGKTSLLNAGILYPMRTKEEAMLSLRFNSTLNEFEAIFKRFSEVWTPEIGDALLTLFHTEKNIIALEKERSALKEAYLVDRGNANVERYRQSKIELKDEQIEYSKKVKELDEAFVNFYQKLDQVPILILDQFEELFIFHDNSNEYVDNIGILLDLLLRNSFPIKIFLFIRSEYFGHLVHLEKYFPKVFYPKVLVDVPGRETLEVITTSLFNEFKINAEKPVIDQILNNICVKRGIDSFEQSDLYFLPYLQIYLDTLYQRVFKRTYSGEKFDSENLKEITVEVNDVRNLGSINKVLLKIIRKLNRSILDDIKDIENDKIKIRIQEIKFPVTVLLKRLVSSKNTKKRIYFTDNGFTTNDLNYLLGGFGFDNISEEEQHSVLDLILNELKVNRLIIKNDKEKYIELTHDSLAVFIDAIVVDKHEHELYAQKFVTDYEIHVSNKRKNKKYFLDSETQDKIGSPEKLKRYLSSMDMEMTDEYTKFWDDSDYHNKATERITKWIRNGVLAIITICLLVALGFLLNSEVANMKTNSEKVRFETEQKKNEKQGEIFLKVGTAYGEGKYNLKEAYEHLKINEQEYLDIVRSKESLDLGLWDVIKNPSRLWKRDTISENIDSLISLVKISLDTDEKYKIRRQYFEDLEGNKGKRPFYKENIDLGNTHLVSTKSRMLKDASNTLVIFGQTHESLKLHKIDLNKYDKLDSAVVNGDIHAYEPYYSNKKLKVLVSIDKKLKVFNEKLDVESGDEKVYAHNFSIIEKVWDGKFLCLADDEKSLFLYDLKNEDLRGFSKMNVNGKREKISFISYSADTKEIIYVLKNSAKIYKLDSLDRISSFPFPGTKIIKSIKVKQNGTIYLADRMSVYKINTSEFNEDESEEKDLLPIIVHSDEDNWEIRTIDIFEDNYIIGTQGNLAQTYYNPLERFDTALKMQKLIGHSAEIINVSYVKKGKYLMTSSRDGSIKFWDIRDRDIKETSLPTINNGISKMQFHNGSLYVGFRLIETIAENGPGYIAEFDDTLGLIKKYFYRGSLKEIYSEIEMPNFDFDPDGSLVAGTYWRRELRNAQVEGDMTESIKIDVTSTIRDVRIVGPLIALATDEGIELFKLNQGKYVRQNPLNLGVRINAVDINKHYNQIIGAGEDGNVYAWNLNLNKIDTLREHHDKVSDVCFSPSGNFFVSSSWDNNAVVWNNLDKENILLVEDEIHAHFNDIEDVDISTDNVVATASSDNTVQLHKIYQKDNTFIIKRLPSYIINSGVSIRSVTFGESNNIIYTGDKNGVIKKWDINDFKDN